ncbi:hypothetical protein [Methylovulum psychrotolerans]|nr:hypothetical protein [Methylovulum psychrotolerans]
MDFERLSTMAFVNEAISEDNKRKLRAEVSFTEFGLKAGMIPKFSRVPSWWTVDRERGVYLFQLDGYGEGPQLTFCVLGVDGQTVVFGMGQKGSGDDEIGLHLTYNIHQLFIPPALELRHAQIKQLICESLEEDAYFRPYADGGTVALPNTTARGNILSFNVEFK